MKSYIWMSMVCVLLAVVNGKYHPKSKVENSPKHRQNLEYVRNPAHHIENGDHRDIPESGNESDLKAPNTPKSADNARDNKQRNIPDRGTTHGKSQFEKSHGRQKTRSQDIKTALKDRNTEKIRKSVVRDAVQEQPTRRVQKWLDDKQQRAQHERRNSQKDATRQLVKVKNGIKFSHPHQRGKPSSISKHQQPYTKRTSSKNGHFSNTKNPRRSDLVHRLKKNQAHLIKDINQVKKAQGRVDRDLRKEKLDVNVLSHRHKTPNNNSNRK